MGDALILTACHVARDVSDKAQCRADARLLCLGAQAKPITEQVLAWQYQLERTQTRGDLGAAAARCAKEGGGCVGTLLAPTQRSRIHVRRGLKCPQLRRLLLAANDILRKKQRTRLDCVERSKVRGLDSHGRSSVWQASVLFSPNDQFTTPPHNDREWAPGLGRSAGVAVSTWFDHSCFASLMNASSIFSQESMPPT